MFVTPGPIKESTSFQCLVELTQEIMGRAEIVFDAECRWCRKNVHADRWESGYRLYVTGIDAYLIQFLVLSFKVRGTEDDDLSEVKTIEMENRRSSIRYNLNEPLPVYEQHGYRQIGELADVSIHGVRIITPRRYERNQVLRCRVTLPKKVFQQEHLAFDVKCMWCRREKEGIGYETGYRIVAISEKDAPSLLYLLVHHAKPQETKRRAQVVA